MCVLDKCTWFTSCYKHQMSFYQNKMKNFCKRELILELLSCWSSGTVQAVKSSPKTDLSA